ncbi:MAG: circadian clock protein KaiB [Bradyrhizobiaceae bacterium]|nr:MAG: circadian clock protein KaiB [Bradyrhizobiaceae bacterium]
MTNAEKAIPENPEAILRLYIAGTSPSSRQAEQKFQGLIALMKAGAGRVEVIDVLASPDLAERAGILATPTLCYEYSGRCRRIVGDLGDFKKILAFLGIEMKGEAP